MPPGSKRMFAQQMASIYEAVHGRGLDYAARTQMICALVAAHKTTTTNVLLDVACGTGRLLERLSDRFDVEGLDASPAMLDLARKRLPNVRFFRGNMSSFHTRRRYDVITCVGASLCYAQSVRQLNGAVRAMAKRLKHGGILIADTWLQPDQYGALAAEGVCRIDIDEADRKISVLRRHECAGRSVVLDYHYMIGTLNGVSYFNEKHRVSMFSKEENLAAFRYGGLQPLEVADPDGLFRGCRVYVAHKR